MIVALCTTGCGKGEAKQSSAAPLCAEADDLLNDIAGDPESAALVPDVLNKTVQLCESACSEKDAPSCDRLKKAVTTVCANPVICKQLCDLPDENETKKIACAALAAE
jgi:hypothetical protein